MKIYCVSKLSEDELIKMDINVLDRSAFGFSEQDIKSLYPNQIQIIHRGDLENAKYAQEISHLSPKEWAKKVDLTKPVEVVYQGGRFVLEDGHHRWLAAYILGKKLAVSLTIKDNPISVLLGRQ